MSYLMDSTQTNAAQVNPRGDVVMSLLDGSTNTFSASASGFSPLASDIFTITGSASKTIHITRISVSGTATLAVNMAISLLRRSNANTGGTLTTAVAVVHDTTNIASTGLIQLYTTAATSLGTSSGALRVANLFVSTLVSTPLAQVWTFGDGPRQALVLRGVSQVLAINFSSAPAGGTFAVDVEWFEQ